MLAWRAMGPRLLALGIMSFLAATILWPVGSANGQPLFQGSLACPAGLPTGEQVGHGLLGALTAPLPAPETGDPLNNAWLQAAPAIPNQTIVLDRVHVPDGCALGGSDFCTFIAGAGGCSFTFVDMTLQALQGLDPLRFTGLDVLPGGVNQREVAAHTNRGPDASVITDGVFAPDGHDATDTAYAIVLPHNLANGAIVIDLGTNVTVCGVASGCSAPKIQADNDDIYQLDYSTDGKAWSPFGAFAKTGGSGLHTRPSRIPAWGRASRRAMCACTASRVGPPSRYPSCSSGTRAITASPSARRPSVLSHIRSWTATRPRRATMRPTPTTPSCWSTRRDLQRH